MGEPNGKYSVRGVCVDAGEIRWWTWCLGLRPKSFFFVFPRNPPDVHGDPVDVSAASCTCLPLWKKKSSHAAVFGRKRKVWIQFLHTTSDFFSARGYPLRPAQKYGCLVVISGSVHVQLYLPSVSEKKIFARGYFRSQAKSLGVQWL